MELLKSVEREIDRGAMSRDIDQIIAAVKHQVPGVRILQMHKTHAGDDDGLWWFSIPGVESEVQVESSDGNCPFLIESDDFSCAHAKSGASQEEVTSIVVKYLRSLLPA